MDTLRNERSALKSAEEKGIQKGLQKGLEQGAKQEKLEIAKKLIQNGLDNNFIIETTGLTLDEVRELRKENESKCVKHPSRIIRGEFFLCECRLVLE